MNREPFLTRHGWIFIVPLGLIIGAGIANTATKAMTEAVRVQIENEVTK